LGGMRAIVLFITVLTLACAMVPSPASGDWRQFIPRMWEQSGELEVYSTYQYNENKSDGTGIKSTDFFARERFNYYLSGYVYHPRFIQYTLKLSVGLKEENFKSSVIESGWTTGNSTDYNFSMIILPEHPYNLQLYTLRYEPLTQGAFSPQSSSVIYNKGAIFTYKEKPYFVNLSYLDSKNESSVATFDTQTYNASGTYWKEYKGGAFLALSGSYYHVNSDSSVSSIKSSSDTGSLINNITYKNATLASSFVYSSFDQGGAVTDFNNKVFTWSESLNVRLPWNFAAGLGYNYTKSKSTSSAQIPPLTTDNTESAPSEVQSTSTSNNFRFNLTHRLYDSLFTQYSFGYAALDTTFGNSTVTSNTLGINYAKNIPWGRLMAGANYNVSVTDRTGSPAITNELHTSVAVPNGFFLLDNPDVDINTISIFVKNPEAPFELNLLTPDFDYTLTVIGTTVRVTVFNLPPHVPTFPIPGTYDFVANYSLTSANAKFQTTNITYNASLSLFDDLLYPYYTHTSSRQKVLSGTIEGEPLDQTSDVLGIYVSRLPWSLLVEYTNVSSNITPYWEWRTELRYMKDITYTTHVQAAARYSYTDYLKGSSSFSTQPYTDKIAGIDAGIQQRFPSRDMSVSLYGSYTREMGQSNSDTYGGNAVFSWTTRQLLLTIGATLAYSTNEVANITSKRLYEYYYLNVKRKLF